MRNEIEVKIDLPWCGHESGNFFNGRAICGIHRDAHGGCGHAFVAIDASTKVPLSTLGQVKVFERILGKWRETGFTPEIARERVEAGLGDGNPMVVAVFTHELEVSAPKPTVTWKATREIVQEKKNHGVVDWKTTPNYMAERVTPWFIGVDVASGAPIGVRKTGYAVPMAPIPTCKWPGCPFPQDRAQHGVWKKGHDPRACSYDSVCCHPWTEGAPVKAEDIVFRQESFDPRDGKRLYAAIDMRTDAYVGKVRIDGRHYDVFNGRGERIFAEYTVSGASPERLTNEERGRLWDKARRALARHLNEGGKA